MVFPSAPVYLDPPNWQSGKKQHQSIPSHDNYNSSSRPVPQTHAAAAVVDSAASASRSISASGASSGQIGSFSSIIRPGSMADKARMMKHPLPEAGLKCPRCESTNTKFCYFNNYNLSQPRHFCKTCRRYWTRGGALRNVPVGGGCRRNNKRGKTLSNPSKCPLVSTSTQGPTSSQVIPCRLPPQLPFMLGNYTAAAASSEVVRHSDGMRLSHQIPRQSSSSFRQQFPFLMGLEPSPPQLHSTAANGVYYDFRSVEGLQEYSGMKMDDIDSGGIDLFKNFLGINHHDNEQQQVLQNYGNENGNDRQYSWNSGNAWPDLL